MRDVCPSRPLPTGLRDSVCSDNAYDRSARAEEMTERYHNGMRIGQPRDVIMVLKFVLVCFVFATVSSDRILDLTASKIEMTPNNTIQVSLRKTIHFYSVCRLSGLPYYNIITKAASYKVIFFSFFTLNSQTGIHGYFVTLKRF